MRNHGATVRGVGVRGGVRLSLAAAATSLVLLAQTAATMTSDFTLRLERTLAASPVDAFRLWTDAGVVTKWFVHDAAVHWSRPPMLDTRVGGQIDWEVVDNVNASDVYHFRGSYLQIKPPDRLVFSWNWQALPIERVAGAGNTTVSVLFVPEGKRTRVELIQSGLPTEPAREAHRKGWNRCLDGMERILMEESQRRWVTGKH